MQGQLSIPIFEQDTVAAKFPASGTTGRKEERSTSTGLETEALINDAGRKNV